MIREKEVTIPLCVLLIKAKRANLCGSRGKGKRLSGRAQVSAQSNKNESTLKME